MSKEPDSIVKKWIAKAGIDGFLIGIGIAVLLGYYWPRPGIATHPVSLDTITAYGVALIFFFYGLRLSPQKMKAGLSNWNVHIVIQLTTFLLFPLIVLCFRPFFTSAGTGILWPGFFFLAALPSTVSSSVVMVAIAYGNIPAAIFNASISSLLGIFITPLWTTLILNAQTGELNHSSVILNLCLQVLLPVCAGLLLHRRFGFFADKNKTWLRRFDQLVILLIIYSSFSHSFTAGIFEGIGNMPLLVLSLAVLLLFLIVFMLTSLISRWLGLTAADRITAVFCGSKKSLVHGSVMAKVLFGNSAAAGLIILPVMLYHALQLVIISIIARRRAKRFTGQEA